MASLTYVFADNFESGDASGWDIAESDTSNQLDFPHYTTLAQEGLTPFSGSYCMRVKMADGTTDDATIGDSDIDILDGETFWIRFNIFLHELSAAGTDIMDIFQLQDAGGTVIFAIGLDILSTGLHRFKIGATSPPLFAFSGYAPLETWMTMELETKLTVGVGGGYFKAYLTVDGQEPIPTGSPTGSLTNTNSSAAIAQGVLGTRTVASSTTGTILFDNFAMSASRIWPQKDRFSTSVLMNQTGHAFIGPGYITGVTLSASAAADNIVSIYDTDTAQAHDSLKKLVLANVSNSEVIEKKERVRVERGCYVEIAGTDYPEVSLNIERAPAWFSDGNIRRHALKRSLHP